MKPKLPAAPRGLGADGRRLWQSVVNQYILEGYQFESLRMAAKEYDRHCKAEAVVQKLGMTYTDRFGQPKERPEVSIARNAGIAAARHLRELSLDVDPPADVRLPRLAG